MTSSTQQQLRRRLSPEIVADILAVPPVRADAVARAQAHLSRTCPAEKIAAELLDCFIDRRLP